MKPIELSLNQKNKLIEMCNKLFPELQTTAEIAAKHWCKSASENIDNYEYGFRLSEELSPVLYCSYPIDYDFHTHLLPNDKNPGIHWFEFCYTFLFKKILVDPYGYESINDYISMNSSFIFGHPVDYLYEEFKKLKI